MKKFWLGWAVLLAASAPAVFAQPLVTTDHFVKHVSTLPVNTGMPVALFVRQKVLASKRGTKAPVVLFVHGATVPGVPDYDLEYKDYNWMAYLARAGFNTLYHGFDGLRRFAQADDG